MTFPNPGPGLQGNPNLAGAVYPGWVGSISKTALIGPDGSSVSLGTDGSSFNVSVTDAPATSINNYSPVGYAGGITNRLLLAAASGGTTLTGLVAATDGWSVFVYNTSTTDVINFSHLSSSSSTANRFSCPQGVSATLNLLTGVLLIYVSGIGWTFG